MAVADFALRNIAQEAGIDNLSGIEAAWYTYAADLVDFPAEGSLPIAQLNLRAGATWYQLVSIRDTVRYKQTPKDLGRHGQSYTHQLAGTLARHTAELAQALEALEGQELVLLYRDRNGEVQLVGTPTEPLSWGDAYDTGESYQQRNNYDWKLSTETARRARSYLGTWQVGNVGLGSVLGVGSGGSVVLRTPNGQVLAIVPAGKSIVLGSSFQLNYQIV
jgi:hypothetical protein